jgi:hypothetical protein
MGAISDVVHGKEKTIQADPLAGAINSAGRSGLSYLQSGGTRLNQIYKQSPTQLVKTQIGLENAVARDAAEDATRRTRSLIAQRGMGNSSIGLGQEVNQKRSLMERLGLNNASEVGRIRDASIENAQGQMSAGQALLAPKFNAASSGLQMTPTTYRTGGYGQLLMEGGKAYAGYAGLQSGRGQ